jgi:hypothetical protein
MTRQLTNAQRATGFETMRSADGMVLQAGIPSRSMAMHEDGATNARGWITRAVVIKTYYTEEDTRCGWTEGLQRNVLCDVRTYGRYSRPLSKVPVLQRTQGLWDLDIYIPRDSKQNMEGGELATGGSKSTSVPTPGENMDGDHVLVGFLDNDPAMPVILPFQFCHPKSNYQPQAADGRVRRIRHQGTLLEWDKDGNFTIDATGVAAEEFGPAGTEVPAVGKGTITFVNQDALGAKLSMILDASSAGKLLLGSDPAVASDEPFVCGTLLVTAVEALIDAIKGIATTAPATVDPGSQQALENTKAAFTAALSDFIMGKKAQ